METFYCLLYVLQFSSALRVSPDARRDETARYRNTDDGNDPNRDNIREPLQQLRNFDRGESYPVVSHHRSTGRTLSPPMGSRDGPAELPTANSEAQRPHKNVLSDSKNGVVNEEWFSYQVEGGLHSIPLTEASPLIQMGQTNSRSPSERQRWFTSQNPSTKTRSSTSRRQLPSSSYTSPSLRSSWSQNPSSSQYTYSSQNPSPSPNPSPSRNPSSSPNPSPSQSPPPSPSSSALPYYASTMSYSPPSTATALHNLVSLSPSPYNNEPNVNISPQPSLPSANSGAEKIQASTAATVENRFEDNKNLLVKFRTIMTVSPSPLSQIDYSTKTYLMVFDEHGVMHKNFTPGSGYWDNVKQKI